MIEELLKNSEDLIKQMKLHPNVLNDFREGVINCSEEPLSTLFWANDEQKKIIEKIEEKGLCKVWHIIKGKYRFDGEYEQIETYLLAIEEAEELPEWNDGYLARSYSRFLTANTSDYGDVVIKPNNGGLKRTM